MNPLRFYLSFLDDNPRPDAAVIQALNEGASQLIVAEVFVSVSNHTLEGKNLINKLGLEDYGIPIYLHQSIVGFTYPAPHVPGAGSEAPG